MRIAQVSTLAAPVAQDAAGSVEAMVWLLTRELNGLGHQVTVFGTAGSRVDGELVATLPGPYGTGGSFDDWQLCEWVNLSRAVAESGRFDVLHCHAYLWGMPLEALARAPMVHTLHIVPDQNAAGLRRLWPEACVTALSRHQWSEWPDLAKAPVIPHGVDIAQFPFRAKPDDYLLYLGRFTSGKGPRFAIQAAKAVGMRLVLAGPESPYYREHIKPVVDGKCVEYVGPVKPADRSRLLGGARALLYPIQYPEAFGLVLVEAMLCGTPVAAMNLGAVPEILEEGVTGCMTKSVQDFAAATLKAMTLDRGRVRAAAEPRFSAAQMAQSYVRVFEQVIGSVKR